jgi:hypothetical protein
MFNQVEPGQAFDDVEAELLNFLIDSARHSPPFQATYPTPEQLAGYYRNAAPGQEILAELEDVFGGTEVEQRPDGLWERTRNISSLRSLVTSGTWEHLVPTDASGSFRLDHETIASRFFTRMDGTQVLVTQMGYFEKANQFVAAMRRRLMQLALIVLLSGLLLIPLALIRASGVALPGPLAGVPGLPILVPAALQTLIALTTWIVLTRADNSLGDINASSVWIFVASMAFPLIAVIALTQSIRHLLDTNEALIYRAYLLLFSAAGGGLTLLAWAAHWIGLRTWAF